MRSKRCVAVLVVAFAMTGCATRPPAAQGVFLATQVSNGAPLTSTGIELTRGMGEVIYATGMQATEKTTTVRFLNSGRAEMDAGHHLALMEGQVEVLQMRTSNGHRAVCRPTGGSGNVAMIATGGGRAIGCAVDQDGDGQFDFAMFQQYEREFAFVPKVRYAVEKVTESPLAQPRDVVQRRLVYQGVQGGTLRLSYREFINGLARDAFTQELTYSLDAQGRAEVGFQGLRIRVLSAGNSSIQYVVDRPMD